MLIDFLQKQFVLPTPKRLLLKGTLKKEYMEGKYEKPTSVIITYFSNIKVNKKLDKNANEYLAKSIMFCKQKWLLLKGT
jgi:hypothetical protein